MDDREYCVVCASDQHHGDEHQDVLAFSEPLTPANPAAPAPRKCRRHDDRVWIPETNEWECMRCGHRIPVERVRAGRNARKRGNRHELTVARAIGGTKVGMYGGPSDVETGMFSCQVKYFAAGRYPGWMSDELAKLPRTGGRVPLLIVGEATGGRGKGRALAIVDLDDWRSLHGETT